MSLLLQLCLLLISVVILFIFIRFNSSKGWVRSRALFIIIWVIFSLILTFLLWLDSREIWIIHVGLSFSLLICFAIWYSPVIAPEFAKQLDLDVEEFETPRINKKVLSAIITFLFITLGYWLVIFMFDTKVFWSGFTQQLWIVPVALLFAIVQFIRTN